MLMMMAARVAGRWAWAQVWPIIAPAPAKTAMYSTLSQSPTRSGRTSPFGAVQTRQITVITISCTVAMPSACWESDHAPSPTMWSA